MTILMYEISNDLIKRNGRLPRRREMVHKNFVQNQPKGIGIYRKRNIIYCYLVSTISNNKIFIFIRFIIILTYYKIVQLFIIYILIQLIK